MPAVPVTVTGLPSGRKLIIVPTPHALVSRTNSSSSAAFMQPLSFG